MSIRTILSVSDTAMDKSPLVNPVPGLLGLEENWVNHTLEKMDRSVSDLQIWSEDVLDDDAVAGVLEDVTDGEDGDTAAADAGYFNKDFLAGVDDDCPGCSAGV